MFVNSLHLAALLQNWSTIVGGALFVQQTEIAISVIAVEMFAGLVPMFLLVLSPPWEPTTSCEASEKALTGRIAASQLALPNILGCRNVMYFTLNSQHIKLEHRIDRQVGGRRAFIVVIGDLNKPGTKVDVTGAAGGSDFSDRRRVVKKGRRRVC